METIEVRRSRAIALFEPSAATIGRLGAWFAAEYDALLRFAYFVSGDAATAQDLVQDAFVRLSRARGVTDDGMRAYARATIVNLSRSRHRRRTTESRHLESARAGHSPDPASAAGDRDEVWQAILSLSPQQRACIALRFYEDMSERDVAATLGLSAGAVKTHTSRAMDRLRDLLGHGRDA